MIRSSVVLFYIGFFDFEIVWLDIDIVWGVDVVGNEILLVLGG